ncbi:very short patch repair endonuclease [Mesorhizobium sp. CA7]|uniref:very short patch repair endonuclease n=1 Tax=Mesorhizobium sp. CA7 TaxID=588501 RepID=UPI002961F468|nr:very short patch repair endonuclease [Mesorhizobium sp. CA7]
MPQKTSFQKMTLFENVPAARRHLMSKVRSKNTKPELILRRHLHSLGYRYRLHQAKLPGSPDIVFGPRKAAIFVHGCFWHRHHGCPKATTPKARKEFWEAKFRANIERDARKISELSQIGWRVMIVWECETSDLESLNPKVASFLEAHS